MEYIARPILRQGLKWEQRVLRPIEVDTMLEKASPKLRLRIQVFLYTAARYAELQRLTYNKNWFDGKSIHFPEFKVKRTMRGMRDRYVHLSYLGQEAVRFWLNSEDPRLPKYQNIDESIKVLALHCHIDPTALSVKTFRKTYESWLIHMFPERTIAILQSTGHTENIATAHYINLPFDDEDVLRMKKHVEGWQ